MDNPLSGPYYDTSLGPPIGSTQVVPVSQTSTGATGLASLGDFFSSLGKGVGGLIGGIGTGVAAIKGASKSIQPVQQQPFVNPQPSTYQVATSNSMFYWIVGGLAVISLFFVFKKR